MASGDSVLVETQGNVLVITVNRPDVRNALDLPTVTLLAEAIDELDSRTDISVGVLTGAGGHFSAGMDLKAFLATGRRPEVPGRGLGFTRTPPRKPLIAAVEGYALAGGFELVLACDLVVAAQEAVFGFPEVKRGLIAGSGGLLRLPQRIPVAIALEYSLTGRSLPAEIAYQWGLVNRLTASGQALESALELASEIAGNAPLSLAATKQLVTRGAHPDERAVALQDELLEVIVASADAREGAAAFADKRPPVWENRS